ncbi:MAG: hypothetical protein CVU38_09585 [Chloroflexi bacterium HGW-Chloroflexi-1]|nr:MAG: hypothetical protein CVU38_09585 [Chloroflexi bacterium HGW-Chloroflexi-1]
MPVGDAQAGTPDAAKGHLTGRNLLDVGRLEEDVPHPQVRFGHPAHQEARVVDDRHHRVFAGGEGAPVGQPVGEEVRLPRDLEPAGGVDQDLVGRVERLRGRRRQSRLPRESHIGPGRTPPAQPQQRQPDQDEERQDRPMPR